jgi:hypothetical protein
LAARVVPAIEPINEGDHLIPRQVIMSEVDSMPKAAQLFV